MTKNPFLNALAALSYISAVVLFIFNVPPEAEDSGMIFVPIIFLSTFVLSAACMAFIFFYQPFRLYFDGKQKEAVTLIVTTILSFGAITLALGLSLYYIFGS